MRQPTLQSAAPARSMTSDGRWRPGHSDDAHAVYRLQRGIQMWALSYLPFIGCFRIGVYRSRSRSVGLYRVATSAWSPIPAATRIIAHGSQHGQDNHHAETGRAGPRDDLRNAREIRYGSQQYDNEDVQHRPLADEFDQFVQTRALALYESPAPTPPQHQDSQGQQLGQRHHHAGNKHNDRQIPGTQPPKLDNAAQYGVHGVARKGTNPHDGQQIGGHIQYAGRDHQRPDA